MSTQFGFAKDSESHKTPDLKPVESNTFEGLTTREATSTLLFTGAVAVAVVSLYRKIWPAKPTRKIAKVAKRLVRR